MLAKSYTFLCSTSYSLINIECFLQIAISDEKDKNLLEKSSRYYNSIFHNHLQCFLNGSEHRIHTR